MKQHITEDQLNELSKENINKLWIFYMDQCEHYRRKPLLSIGQMIEFLDDHLKEIRIWKDEYRVIFKPNDKMLLSTYTELCDALWAAVKNKLSS